MMRCLVLLFLLSPVAVAAQDIALRTGWHPGFTRVVFSIPEGESWTLGKTEDGYGVFISGATFDVAGFFNRIPRDRISDTRSTESQLDFVVACDCYADAFLWRPDRLVVDIRDGTPPPDNPYEVALSSSEQPETLDLDLLPKPPSLSDISPLAQIETATSEIDLAGFEEQVIAGLGRAADQGLISFAAGESATSARADAPVPATPPLVQNIDIPIDAPRAPNAFPGLLSRTSRDLATSLDKHITMNAIGQQCWPDDLFLVETWGDDAPFSTAVGVRRGRIFGEFDKVDPDAVEDLAKLFIFYGFGREALQTLSIDGALSRKRGALRSLAQIVDGERLDPDILASQTSCPGRVALWAAISGEDNVLLQAADTLQIVQSFRDLPDHLQRHLGPRLAEKFVNIDQPDLAEMILGSGAATEQQTVQNTAVSARIEADRGDLNDAIRSLAKMAATNPDTRPNDIIQLVTLQLDAGQNVDQETLALLATMQFEQRGTDVYDRLTDVHIRALIAANQIDAARDMLTQNRDQLEASARLGELLATAAVVVPNDLTFLDFALSENHDPLPPSLQNNIAARLLDLGFPEEALFILRNQTTQEAMAERRYLRARAAMINGDQFSAEGHLAGIDTDRARRILAGEAGGVLGDDLAASADQSAAWRSGDWSTLATGQDDLLQAASTLRLRETLLPEVTDQPLAIGRDLLSEAAGVRTTVDDLLMRFDVSEP